MYIFWSNSLVKHANAIIIYCSPNSLTYLGYEYVTEEIELDENLTITDNYVVDSTVKIKAAYLRETNVEKDVWILYSMFTHDFIEF